ncbi:hypothetical protein [Nocardioides lijunqiniae]|uniref:hypothetical protein n=1 Tax=Nocardioides lijunqiniae TaxID=2760832 RepID=UPI001877F02F|nr:hypothetical protein [Nocardioides lijunqiniae]
MSHMGIRQGLAASAVAALTITGLAMTPAAQAAPGDPGAVLLSLSSGIASTKTDSELATSSYPIQLVAARLEPAATIAFEVNADPRAGDAAPGWTDISVNNVQDEGDFAVTQWDGGLASPGDLVGTRVSVRVVSTLPSQDPTYSTRHDVAVTGEASPADSVSFTGFNGGVFTQPYDSSQRTQQLVGLTGTTTATSGQVELSQWRRADGTFHGLTDAAVSPQDLKVSATNNLTFVDGGRFDGAVELSAFDATLGDRVAVRAALAGGRSSDEVDTAQLYEQTIQSFGVLSDKSVTTSQGTSITLSVTDQKGSGVAGVEVRLGDGSLVGYTDGGGRIRHLQPNSSTATYYVNTTDVDEYETSTDYQLQIDAPAYTPAASGVELVLADGKVFDDQEYAAGDIALQIVDQEGEPFPGVRDLEYRLYPTGGQAPSDTTVTTNASGRAVLPFDPAGPDGAWTLVHTDGDGLWERRRHTLVAGDSTLRLTPAAGAASSGGQVAYAGSLRVGEWPVSGRAISLGYTRGVELVPGKDADAGILAGGARKLTGSVTTSKAGAFAVTVADAAEAGAPSETGALRAEAKAAKETVTAKATFGSGKKGTAKIRLTGSSKGAKPDRLVVTGPASVAGERVRLSVKVGRKWKAVKTIVLDKRGRRTVTVKDSNGAATTTYRAQLLPSKRVQGSTSGVKKLR